MEHQANASTQKTKTKTFTCIIQLTDVSIDKSKYSLCVNIYLIIYLIKIRKTVFSFNSVFKLYYSILHKRMFLFVFALFKIITRNRIIILIRHAASTRSVLSRVK